MFTRIAHIGVAVKNVAASRDLFEKLFGQPPDHSEVVDDQHVETIMYRIGETAIELVAPTDAESPIARFIEKRGEGIHHISFVVDDIERELSRLKGEGFRLIDEKPRIGADNYLVAFLHPKSTNGVLVEISQKIQT